MCHLSSGPSLATLVTISPSCVSEAPDSGAELTRLNKPAAAACLACLSFTSCMASANESSSFCLALTTPVFAGPGILPVQVGSTSVLLQVLQTVWFGGKSFVLMLCPQAGKREAPQTQSDLKGGTQCGLAAEAVQHGPAPAFRYPTHSPSLARRARDALRLADGVVWLGGLCSSESRHAPSIRFDLLCSNLKLL
jgi:hypothetical protein